MIVLYSQTQKLLQNCLKQSTLYWRNVLLKCLQHNSIRKEKMVGLRKEGVSNRGQLYEILCQLSKHHSNCFYPIKDFS